MPQSPLEGTMRPVPPSGCGRRRRVRGRRRRPTAALADPGAGRARHPVRRRLGRALVLRRLGRRPHAGRLDRARGRRRPRLFLRHAIDRRISASHEVRCTDATATDQKYCCRRYDVKAAGRHLHGRVYRPTRLVGDIAGPLSLAELGQAPMFAANWSRARLTVTGVPPYPDTSSPTRRPHLARPGRQQPADFPGRTRRPAGPSGVRHAARSSGHRDDFAPCRGDRAARCIRCLPSRSTPNSTSALSGFNDLLPKPWPERFREMQANGGGVEIKALRFAQGKHRRRRRRQAQPSTRTASSTA